MNELERELRMMQEGTHKDIAAQNSHSYTDLRRTFTSGWGPANVREDVPDIVPKGLNPDDIELYLLRMKLEMINSKLKKPILGPEDYRSPSPEPTYDANGKRTNTREVRYVEKLHRQRDSLIKDALKVNPKIIMPTDYKPEPYTCKVKVPTDKYPEYNFIGLILGPRGNTQKRLERETNVKISIRGKGAVKEGKSRTDPKNLPGGDEPLHVLLTASRQEDLEEARVKIEELLVPVEEEKNDMKRQQLRELAAINGTLRDYEICKICGEVGHRTAYCPNKRKNWSMANVCCAVCGEKSHPTADCPQMKNQSHGFMEHVHEMDNAFNNLIEDIGSGSGGGSRAHGIAHSHQPQQPQQPRYPESTYHGYAPQMMGHSGQPPMPPPPQMPPPPPMQPMDQMEPSEPYGQPPPPPPPKLPGDRYY